MSASEAAQLLRQLHTAEPSHEMHEELVQMARRRVARAEEKLAADQRELAAAEVALERATAAQADFASANPEPQMEIFP